ncbi:PREDICTED: sodium/potassium-transporting ATPase subunit beta-1-interacting protein 3-like isoform X3 [Poecilia mexicana]|uniref:sodium/potassium-transporting ATPase subunit beta-1-interacting protein 3-like isoform X3 n=1 Tax=Poecilia mexicana TaxID=48701 RepID=UPI00072DC09C|nr:PREDICTED: sodium/potassium-transporting ATPase subunit beta-1-interacting protein 3-like isoform X3 [Poecilia mexicana]XP_016527679.1 PREDICTED: sodium/potassium-transporting ATPase subunit beta-1-interacting protein 3-like isoform X3 [Poecilia formosa]
MGCCSGRCMLVLLCCVQLITAVERQVFDFLGYQWAPIMVNFFHIIVVILGLFGAIQYQSRYVTMDSHVLSLGVSSHSSWWKSNGPGCRSQNPASDRWSEHQNPRLTMVSSCWLQYQYLEVLHCAAQLLLSLLGVVYSCYAVSRFPEEESYYK